MSVVAPVKVMIGEKIVVYLETLGRFSGPVVHRSNIGFDIAMQLPDPKREKLARQLNWLANREAEGLPERRHHERIAPLKQWVDMERSCGRRQLVKINDISSAGANISTSFPPPYGAEVLICGTPAVVVRLDDGGFACEFLTPFDVDSLHQRLDA